MGGRKSEEEIEKVIKVRPKVSDDFGLFCGIIIQIGEVCPIIKICNLGTVK